MIGELHAGKLPFHQPVMMMYIALFTIFIYLTILYELVVIPVPSIASTYQLFSTEDDFALPNALLSKVRGWSSIKKMLLLLLPTAIGVAVYMLPLAQALLPAISDVLHPMWRTSSTLIVLLGVLLALVGRAVALYSMWRIRQNNRQQEDSFELKTAGTFAFSRNPGLVGMYICFAGLWLLYPTWEMGIGFLFYAGNMHFRILLEEEYLAWKFGDPYLAYKSQLRRYV